MAYGLSFAEEFFRGEEFPCDAPSSKPTNVFQAIVSLDKRTKVEIAREVLKSPHPVLYSTTEAFAQAVLDKVRETDTCGTLSSPVDVWIDAEGWYTLDVYDSYHRKRIETDAAEHTHGELDSSNRDE